MDTSVPVSNQDAPVAARIVVLEELLQIIRQEHDALCKMDHQLLLDLANRKSNLLESFSRLGEGQIDHSESESSTKVRSLAAECQRQNLVNGMLINKQTALAERTLKVLYSHPDDSITTYGARGKPGQQKNTIGHRNSRFQTQA